MAFTGLRADPLCPTTLAELVHATLTGNSQRTLSTTRERHLLLAKSMLTVTVDVVHVCCLKIALKGYVEEGK